VLHDAHAAEQRQAANQNDTANGAGKAQGGADRPAEQTPTAADTEAQAAARQVARAQWIAARTEKIRDGRKQALQLQGYHREDRLADPQPTRPEDTPRRSIDDLLKGVQQERAAQDERKPGGLDPHRFRGRTR
jgi:hypothetical protein